MAKSKRKRKPLPADASSEHTVGSAEPATQASPVDAAEPVTASEAGASAEPVAETVAESVAEPGAEPAHKACAACGLHLPPQAKFCSGCGEPQIPGLERPIYRVPLPTEAVSRPASQVTVPSVPRVAPRASGAPLIPALTVDRPIPASLLQPGVSVESVSGFPEPEPAAKAVTAVEAVPQPATALHSPHVDSAAAETRGPSMGSAPTAAAPKRQAPQEPTAPAVEPLFDQATEARMLALRTSHEMTLERFERLMVGFRLKPKPRVAAAKPKAPPKEKAEKKPKEKPAKGH